MQFWSLKNLVSYEAARKLQHEFVEKRALDLIPDTVLFLEHASVVTQGRGLQFAGTERPRHMPLPMLPPEIEFAESERGGDLTWHGPGQLVIYPIVKLDGSGFGPDHDVTTFLRQLENLVIDELGSLGLNANAHDNATGVWIGDRKIASLGIAVRKWVSYHGIALNVVNDLAPFHLISPCGFDPEVMTRLQDFPSAWSRIEGAQWRRVLESRIACRFEMGAEVVESDKPLTVADSSQFK